MGCLKDGRKTPDGARAGSPSRISSTEGKPAREGSSPPTGSGGAAATLPASPGSKNSGLAMEPGTSARMGEMTATLPESPGGLKAGSSASLPASPGSKERNLAARLPTSPGSKDRSVTSPLPAVPGSQEGAVASPLPAMPGIEEGDGGVVPGSQVDPMLAGPEGVPPSKLRIIKPEVDL